MRYIGIVGRMASRPLIEPKVFCSDGSWGQKKKKLQYIIFHFESVAEINELDNVTKLQWLKASLTGRGQMALQMFPSTISSKYGDTKKALEERFEPSCMKTVIKQYYAWKFLSEPMPSGK